MSRLSSSPSGQELVECHAGLRHSLLPGNHPDKDPIANYLLNPKIMLSLSQMPSLCANHRASVQKASGH